MNRSFAVIATVGLVFGLLLGFGLVTISVVCTENCSSGVSVNFTYSVGGNNNLTLNVTDTSTCIGPCSGYYPSVSVNWGDGTSSIDTSGSSKLPIPVTFSHTYSAPSSGSGYVVSETVVHELCGSPGKKCLLTPVVGQELIVVGSSGPASCTSNCSGTQTQTSVNVSFLYSYNGRNLSLTDTSAVVGSPTLTSIVVAWGDRSSTLEAATGFSTYHIYAYPGNYTVTETVYWTAAGVSENSSYAQTIAINDTSSGNGGSTASGGGGGGGGVSAHTSVSPLFIWSALTGILVVGFGAMLVTSLVAGENIPAVFGVTGIAAFVGAVAGYALGKTWV